MDETARARLRAAADRIPLPQQTLAGIAVAVCAQHVRPLRLQAWTRPAGWLLIGTGLTVVAVAMRERGSGSLEDPPRLVTQGSHSYSRNPMYLGWGAIHLGLAGATRNAWLLASWPVSTALLHRWVLREEASLRERFGDEYDAYRARVPRYIRIVRLPGGHDYRRRRVGSGPARRAVARTSPRQDRVVP